MNVVILRTNTADFGKIGTYNVQEVGLANALRRKGHKAFVLYLHRDVKKISRDETYKFVYYLPHKSIGLHGMFDVRILGRFKPERIILFSDNQLWAKNVIEWCQKRNIPIVHYFGNVLSDNPNWLHQFYTKLILIRNIKSYQYSINVAKTEKALNDLKDNHVPYAGVINVGLDTDILSKKRNPDLAIRHELGFVDDETVLLFVGRLIWYKKPVLACQILQSLLKRGVRGKLIIIGKGDLEGELKDYIKENNLEAVVEYKHRVPYEEMFKYFIACDCLLNISAQEIFGMTILEAMYYGMPVVAHSAPGPNVIIEDGKSGFLVDYNDDPEKWAAKVQEAIAKREELSAEAHKRIVDNFVWDKIADQFLNVNKNL